MFDHVSLKVAAQGDFFLHLKLQVFENGVVIFKVIASV